MGHRGRLAGPAFALRVPNISIDNEVRFVLWKPGPSLPPPSYPPPSLASAPLSILIHRLQAVSPQRESIFKFIPPNPSPLPDSGSPAPLSLDSDSTMDSNSTASAAAGQEAALAHEVTTTLGALLIGTFFALM